MNKLRQYIRNILLEEQDRINPKADDKVYTIHGFHGTLLSNVESIIKRGLIPGFNPPSGQTWKAEYSGRGIYLHQSFPEHELRHSYDEGDVWSCLIEVKLKAKEKDLAPDEEFGGLDDIEEAMRVKTAIAVGRKITQREIKNLVLVDHPKAREFGNQIKKKTGILSKYVSIT